MVGDAAPSGWQPCCPRTRRPRGSGRSRGTTPRTSTNGISSNGISSLNSLRAISSFAWLCPPSTLVVRQWGCQGAEGLTSRDFRATFSGTCPRVSAVHSPMGVSPKGAYHGAMARILVVDDDSETRGLLTESLSAAGPEGGGGEGGRGAKGPPPPPGGGPLPPPPPPPARDRG